MPPNCNRCLFHLLALFAVIFICSTLILFIYAPHFLRNQIAKSLPIVNDSVSRTYLNWKDIPFEIKNNLYLFNVTNPDAVNRGEKPNLQQLGPFVFIEKREKLDVKWVPAVNSSDNSSTVEYLQYKHWYFVPELSNGSLSDQIQHVNVPLVTAGSKAHSKLAYDALNLAVWWTKSKLFPVHSAGELFYDGYTDALLKWAKKFHYSPTDRFGWLLDKNNTADGVYQIFTGTSGLKDFGKLISWRHKTNLNVWKGECDTFDDVFTNDIFTPFQDETKPSFVKMFVSELCRPMKLYFAGTNSIRGIATNRFMVTNSTLDYGLEENRCFCPDTGCPANGLINETQCMQHAPLGVSMPNFLYADPYYSSKLEGIPEPELERNGFFIDIEPTLGIPIRLAVRMQINVFVENNQNLHFSKNLKESAYYPQIWFDITADMNEEMADQIRLLQKLPVYLNIAAGITLFLGILLAVIWVFFEIRRLRVKKDESLYDTLTNSVSEEIITT